MPKFTHLHGHSEYSLLDGLPNLATLVKAAKSLGMDALAITDHGNLYGAIEFYKSCLENSIKPIVGCELYVAQRSHKSKEGKADTEPFHLTVLTKNFQGYLNLMKLVSISHLEGYYYKPRVDKDLLRQHHEGLICLSGCPSGEFIRSFNPSDPKSGEGVAREYLEIFGEGNYFLEIQNHLYDQLIKPDLEEIIRRDLENMKKLQELTYQVAKKLSIKLGIGLVATNDFHYIKQSDAEAQDALVCIQIGKFLSDLKRLRMIDTPNLYLKSPEEMRQLFTDLPEAISNTMRIAKMCNLEIPLGNPRFPIFDIPEGKGADEYLRELTFERAKDKMELTPERIERLKYELSTIAKKKYATYFLVVADFVNWAKQQGIITNTRGSAAGSLVSYCLGITNIDPIDYMLPFERFLNPLRPSLPDIDVDLADDRREEVIEYVCRKYGDDKVAHIITFGTMLGRAAIRDIGRVMAVPYGEVDRIAKLVPPPRQGFHKALKDSINEVPELSDIYKNDSTYKKLLDLAVKVDGTVRHASVHAAGVVISPEPLTDYTPLQKETNGEKLVTQYDMFAIEDVGLVKMDFLGIRNLSILGRAVEYVEKNQGLKIDINKIPLDDKKAFELLSKGETMGIFQLEGSGITKYLMELKPTNIFDISAMVALYRPGPLSIIPEYIVRKHHPSKISYFDLRMKRDLERSLGLLVYQDDVLLTAINLAGYSWEEVDKFRKAMGKKIPAEMAKQKDKFIEGCIKNGMKREKAEEIFRLVEPFAAYGFNKAHAASYALVAYQTAYMKANFPVEFMTAVMTAEYGDSEKIAAAIEECKRMGIVVLPPDVNLSGVGFTIENLADLSADQLKRRISGVPTKAQGQGIRFGLSAIKNVGVGAIESIIKVRNEKPFTSLFDLCQRVDTRLVNRKTLESLIKAGALDNFSSRAAHLLTLDECLNISHQNAKKSSNGQIFLFGEQEGLSQEVKLPEIDELPLDQLLIFEKDLLGFYLHEPPFLEKLSSLAKLNFQRIVDLSDDDLDKKLTLGGVVLGVKKILTRKNSQEMAFVRIFDGSSEIDCVFFPSLFAQNKHLLEKEKVIILGGKLSRREEDFSFLVDSIEEFEENHLTRVESVSLEVEIPQGADSNLLRTVNQTLRRFPGKSSIAILIPTNGSFKKMNLQYRVDPTKELLVSLENILGENSIRLT